MADYTSTPTVDPIRTTGPGAHGIKAAVYEPLIRYIAGTGPGTGLQTALATAWKMVNQTLLDLTLRKDVSFTDGTATGDAYYVTQSGRAGFGDSMDAAVGSSTLNPGKVPMPPEFEPLWSSTRTLDFGSAKRKSQEQELSALITDHAYIVPMLTINKIYAISPCVLNFKPTIQGAYQPVAVQWKRAANTPETLL